MNRTAIILLAASLASSTAVAADALQPGLIGRYYQMEGSLEDFPTIPAGQKPAVERVDKEINFVSTLEAFPGTKLLDNFYVNWTGVIRIPKDGAYTFHLESDDGSRLFIDGKEVVDNGGVHAMEEKSGSVHLTAGEHAFKAEFFEKDIDAGCKLSWKSKKFEKQIVPADELSH